MHDHSKGGGATGLITRRECLGRLMGSVGAIAAVSALSSCAAYQPNRGGAFPIPPSERGLHTVTAEPYFHVSDKGLQLEGASFDRNGDLLFVDVFGGTIFRLTAAKKLSVVLPANPLGAAGLAIHKGGRIFVAGLGNFVDTGSLFWINPDGSNLTTIVPASAGYLADDLIFDANGGFYFSDFRGASTTPVGGIYYVSPDLKTITPVLPRMAIANGVCLSPDGKALWATETGAGRLHKVELSAPATIARFGTEVPYYFNGFAPDSIRADSAGNVYVAMYSQGRVLVFNPNGIAIGQILLPKRESGHNLRTTTVGFFPGTDDMVILTNDGDAGEGAWIFRAKGYAKGLTLFSHM
ncbi:MAG: SMP-30/gluconolactonase/LRE family protein [Gammaproteobacteria bacterium]